MSEGETVHCEFFGGFRLFDPEGKEVRISVIKGAAIIAYLLLSGRQSVQRAELSGLLWSEKSEAQSRTAMRQCLHQLRNQLTQAGLGLIHITKDTVELTSAPVTSDVEILLGGELPSGLGVANFQAERLLYGLEDLDPAFREWLWETRHRTQGQLSATLSTKLETSASLKERLDVATLLNALNPALEHAARPLIEEHIRVGNLVELLRVYKDLWDALEEEWEEEPSEELQTLVGEARAQLAKQLPAPIDESGGQSLQTQRHKYLCVLALKLTAMKGSEAAAVDFAPFLETAHKVLSDAGGRIIERTGCDLCAVIGLPVSRENDARNVVLAGMALRDLHREQFRKNIPDQPPVDLTIGIDTGTLELANYTAHEAPLEVTGRALDQATLLAAIPSDNAIFATERTVRRLKHLFLSLSEDIPVIEDKVARIIGRSVENLSVSGPGGIGATFIGRAPFLAALRFELTEALSGSLQFVSIQGAAGIGKTRLVQEFLAELASDGMRALAVNCSRYDRSAPLGPLFDLARQLQPNRDDTHAWKLSAEAGAEGFEAGHSIAQEDAQKFAELISAQPTVVFVDDWQWVDDASRKALQQITDLVTNMPVLLIVVARDLSVDDGIVRSSHQVHLPPLNIREVQRKAEDLLQKPIDEMLSTELYTKSGGNPLFLEEICYSIDQEPVGEPLGHLVSSLPANLRAMIASKIEQLQPEDAQIVLALAAHGEVLDTDLLAHVLGHPVNEASLERLCTLDVLSSGVAGGKMRFKHGITRDVAYKMIPPQERQSYHAAYFRALSETMDGERRHDMVEMLALHARESGHVVEAVDLCEQAGDKALAVSSLDQAQRQFHSALTMIDQLPETKELKRRWLSIVIRWAQPCVYSASLDQIPVLERAEKIALELGDKATVAALRYWEGYIYLVLGEYDNAIEALQIAQEFALKSNSPRLSAEITAIHGFTFAAMGNDEIAQEKIKQAIDAKDKNPGKLGRAPVTSAYARATLAVMRADHGDFDAAEELIEDALSRVHSFNHEIESSILNMSAAVYLWRGNWQQAIDLSTRSCKRAERVRASYLMGMSQCIFNYATWKKDGDASSIKGLETAAYWLEGRGMRLYKTFVFGWLADALADQGRFSQSKRAAQQAIEQAQTGEAVGVPMAFRALARAEVAPDGLGIKAALAHLSEADRWAELRSSAHELGVNALVRAEIHLGGQNLPAAGSALSQAQETFQRLAMPQHQEIAAALGDRL